MAVLCLMVLVRCAFGMAGDADEAGALRPRWEQGDWWVTCSHQLVTAENNPLTPDLLTDAGAPTHRGSREHIPTIRKYLRDENEVVRIAAIVTLSQWGDEESRPAIEEAAKSKSFRLRRCAEMALKRLERAAKSVRETGTAEKAPASPSRGGKDEPQF